MDGQSNKERQKNLSNQFSQPNPFSLIKLQCRTPPTRLNNKKVMGKAHPDKGSNMVKISTISTGGTMTNSKIKKIPTWFGKDNKNLMNKIEGNY